MKTAQTRFQRLHDTADFEKHHLNNGITVWLQKPNVVTDYKGYLSVFFKNVGSANDPKGLEGLAHFLEHMLFRGSYKHESEAELKKPIIENGGSINACTSNEFTEYYIEIAQQYFLQALETLHGLVFEPVLNSDHVLLEQQIILREISKDKLSGKSLIERHENDFLLDKKNSMRHHPLGYPSSINKIGVNELSDFYKQYYHASNANIICGGSFSQISEVVRLLEDAFGAISSGVKSEMVQCGEDRMKSGRKIFTDKRYGMDMLDMAYVFPYMPFAEREPLQSLIDMLAGDELSPFVIEMREKRGLTYHVNAGTIANRRNCYAGFKCEMDSTNFTLACNLFLEVLAGLNESCIEKYFIKSNLKRLSAFKSPIKTCKYLVHEIMISGRPYSYRESEAIEDAIGIEDIIAWRDKLLGMEPLVLEFRKK